MGTKADPSRYDGYGKAEPNEPVFTLIGRDPAAPALIREWVRHHQNANTDGAQLLEALSVADEMDKFRMERDAKPKPPVIETQD